MVGKGEAKVIEREEVTGEKMRNGSHREIEWGGRKHG